MKIRKQKSKQGLLWIKSKTMALILCGIAAAGITAGAVWMFGEKEAACATVSVGLQQFADQAYLAAAAPAGQNIAFDADWFDEALGGAPVSSITVTALPSPTEGFLKLGHSDAVRGQIIPRESLGFLRFVPNEGVKESSFRFLPAVAGSGAASYDLACLLKITEGVNCCPGGSGSITAVSTHEGIALSGKLTAEDPEGDPLRFEICTYPTGGLLTLQAETGAFTYTPLADFKGEDSFVWRVQDIYGAYAPAATVTVKVRELASDYIFSDMMGDNNHTHALRISAKGLLSGEEMGGKHYFHPHRDLDRAAFVAILLEAAGIKAPDADNTGYTDDGEIPGGMKGAIKYAKEQGWLGEEDTFRPHDAITRAEAAKIAAGALGLSAPGYRETATDHFAIPVDVADALYAIYEGGYIATMTDGSLSPGGVLSRGDAARFFAKILDGKESGS